VRCFGDSWEPPEMSEPVKKYGSSKKKKKRRKRSSVEEIAGPVTPEPEPAPKDERQKKEELRGFMEHAEGPFKQRNNDKRQDEALVPREVFSNGELRLDRIEVVGFDYDYTLAEYTPALQHLIYDTAKEYLLEQRNYPSQLADTNFDPTFARRGVLSYLRATGRGLFCARPIHCMVAVRACLFFCIDSFQGSCLTRTRGCFSSCRYVRDAMR